jgi:hypothetical protein
MTAARQILHHYVLVSVLVVPSKRQRDARHQYTSAVCLKEQRKIMPNAILNAHLNLITYAPAMLQIMREVAGTAQPPVDLSGAIKHAIALLAEIDEKGRS